VSTFLQNQEFRNDSQRKKQVMRVLKQVQQVSLIVFGWLLVMAVLYGAYGLLFDQNFFTVMEIAVEGDLKHMTVDEIQKRAEISEGENLFRVPMSAVQERVGSHPWVAEVAVRRKLPHTLWIYVTEREPVALMVDEALHYIDAKGAVFPASDDVLEDLPVMTGFAKAKPQDVTVGLDLMKRYQQMPIAEELGLSELHFDPSQGFSIMGSAQPVAIRLGWKEFDNKLNQFSALWPAVRSRGPLPRYIDANVSGKVVAKYDE
jgi:cell division protein FtsQ